MRKLVSIVFAFVLLIALTTPAMAASSPVKGDPAWKAEYSKSSEKGKPDGVRWDRGNASGDKITSNAHSADWDGLYFYWDDKQKDDGVLLVRDDVFDLFEGSYVHAGSGIEFVNDPGFVLTAKNSNNYWGYKISRAEGKVIDAVDGVKIWAFAIPKQFQYLNVKNNGKTETATESLKNINMVFIDGKYKPGKFEIVKNWFNEDGNKLEAVDDLNAKLKFNNGYKLGNNEVKINDFATALKGVKVTVTETPPAGWFEKDGKASQSVNVKGTDNPVQVVTFNNQKDWAYITIVKVWLDWDGNIIDKPEGLEARFDIVGATASGSKFLDVGEGTYKVKEGAYSIQEKPIEGFDLIVATGDGFVRDGMFAKGVVVAGGKYTVTFTNQDPIDPTIQGSISIKKTVDGIAIDEFDGDIADLIKGFRLYAVDEDGAEIADLKPIAFTKLDEEGMIIFDQLADGWYAIEEVLTVAGKLYFEEPPVLYVLIANGMTFTGTIVDFDYDAFFTIVNGYGSGYVLGYPGLNNTGDIFPIAVTDVATGKDYSSFCANAGSRAFAGQSGMGCAGYLVSERIDRDTATYADFLLAYNYIEANYGELKDVRPVAQIVTWILLGAIDYSSQAFDDIDWAAVEAGGTAVPGVKDAKDIVLDVMENYPAYCGKDNNGVEKKIVDVVYMVCEDGHDYHDCQPQLVPIYGEYYGFFSNKTAPAGAIDLALELKEQYEKVTYEPVYAQTGNSTGTLVSLKNNGGGAGNNGHTYVAVDVAAAKEGALAFGIADSSPSNRPVGYSYNVKIEDDKLIVFFDDNFISAKYGAYVVNDPKEFPGNAPSHPATGSSYAFNMPAGYGDTVYLYFHNEGGIKWYDATNITGWKEVGRETLTRDNDSEVALVITDADGKTVFSDMVAAGTVSPLVDGLMAGVYSYAISGDGFDDVTGEVAVESNKTATIDVSITIIGENEEIRL